MLAFVLAAATACGSPAGTGGGQICTAIGTLVGVGVDVQPVIAAKVGDVALTACWSGTCVDRTVQLRPSTAAAQQTCVGDTCSAHMIPTGGKNGFADLPGLPSTPVQLTVRLAGYPDQNLTVTPKLSYPNGPNCDAGGPQAQVSINNTGTLVEH
jgi:hypothetical protein